VGYRNLQEAVQDLEKTGQLRRINVELSADQEIGLIQRRIFAVGGPALLFTNVSGCAFPLLGNLFGSMERIRFLFRDALPRIEALVKAKVDPLALLRTPSAFLPAIRGAWQLLPKRVAGGPALAQRITLAQLPQLKSWPDDGGAFITLPQVYSESPAHPGNTGGNLGMYRVQLSGNDYLPEREVGLHYQIHRGIGVHHAQAIARGERLRVNIFVGGPPSLTVAAVMPLPEGMSELAFAGLLGGHRLPMIQRPGNLPIPAEADFCIVGSIDPQRTKGEGPFGDHLGYYSLRHDFPVLDVEAVYHRPGAIWPFTTVGRPPQEDTIFGAFIHELTAPLIPTVLPGVKAVHAVDAAGVHPLLLALGSERYVPYAHERRPMELLTQANAILGQGQLSLAKYLFILAEEDVPGLNLHDVATFLTAFLQRVDWQRDLHFQTRTTIDTLDYSGSALNQGSKVVLAAAGGVRRELPTSVPENLHLPAGFAAPRLALPGVLVVNGPPAAGRRGHHDPQIEDFCVALPPDHPLNRFPLLVIVDDSDFVSASTDNFVWTTFTRSNPAADIYGLGAATRARHWGCSGSLVIDARAKAHHAPPLREDPALVRKIEALAAQNGPLAGLF
jgi:4-hydroxy-3-polyprenylbenzoate decarboxylase